MTDFISDEEMAKLEGSSPDFISDEEMDQNVPKQLKQTSKIEAAFRGGFQGLTSDFSDEATAKVVSKITGRPEEDVLREVRDKNLAAERSHPYIYGGAKVTGAVAPFFTPAGAVSKIPAVGKALAGGLNAVKGSKWLAPTGLGALQGYGASEETDEAKQLSDAAAGAMFGLGTAGLFNTITAAPSAIRNFASNRAAQQIGAERATIKKFGPDRVRAAGREALDNNLLSTDTEQMQKGVAALQKSSGKRMGEVLGTVDEALGKPVSPTAIGDQLIDEQRGLWNGEKFYDNLLDIVTMKGEKNISLDDAMQLKVFLGKQARFTSPNRSDAANVSGDAYWIVSKHIDDAIEKGESFLGTSNLLADFQKAKKTYANTKVMEPLLENRYAREQGNKMGFGLTNTIVGSQAAQIASAGNPVQGAALMGGKLAWEKYGNIGMAKGADAIADILQYAPQKLGPYAQTLMNASRQGIRNLAITHYMMSKRDPNYFELVKGALEDEKKKKIARPEYKGLGADLGGMIDGMSFTDSVGLDPQERGQPGFEYGDQVPQPGSIKPFSFKRLFPKVSAEGSQIKQLPKMEGFGTRIKGMGFKSYRDLNVGGDTKRYWEGDYHPSEKIAGKKFDQAYNAQHPDRDSYMHHTEGAVIPAEKGGIQFGMSRGVGAVPHEHVHAQLNNLRTIHPDAEKAMDFHLRQKLKSYGGSPERIDMHSKNPVEFMTSIRDALDESSTRSQLMMETDNKFAKRWPQYVTGNREYMQKLRRFWNDAATEAENMTEADLMRIIENYKANN
jgi:hypothetical protein